MEREDFEDKDCGEGKGGFGAWWRRRSLGEKVVVGVGLGALGLGAAAGAFVLFGNIVKWLWNWIMPYLFDLPTIDFWMAWGVVLLSAILFGRASGSSDSGSSRKRKRKMRAAMAAKEDAAEFQGGESEGAGS